MDRERSRNLNWVVVSAPQGRFDLCWEKWSAPQHRRYGVVVGLTSHYNRKVEVDKLRMMRPNLVQGRPKDDVSGGIVGQKG